MWNPSDALERRLRAGVAVFGLTLALSGPALAQEQAPSAPAAPAESPAPPAAPAPAQTRQDLRRVIEKSYEVLPLHNGVVLRPRKERLGVRTIEVSGDTIAVNGERVTEGVLRAWLAAEADPVLRLHRLPPRERQALFGLQLGDAELPETAPAEQPEGETEIPAEGELPAEAPESPEAPEAPDTPATPEEPDFPSSTSGSRINFGGDIVIAKDELAEEAVAIVGSVRVEGEVSRDVTAVGGSVVINGRVGGNVHAVGGGVRLGPNAVVDGDVSTAGGTVVRAEGSQIHGKVSEVGMDPSDRDRGRGRDRDDDFDISFHPWSPFLNDTMDLYWHLVWTGLLALLVCLCLLVARRPMERVEYYVRSEPWVSGLVGFAAQLLFVPLFAIVTFLLVITIVGCALIALYPFLFIALALAVLLGYAAVAHQFGRFLETRFGRRFGSPYAVALVGVVALGLTSLLGRLIGLGGGILDFLAFTLMAFGFVVQYVAVTIGMGAVLQARFGGARGGPYPASTLPPPPPPAPVPVPYDPVLDEPGLDRP
jgi:cytoskeletal protein CcmA (bactofilin family)